MQMQQEGAGDGAGDRGHSNKQPWKAAVGVSYKNKSLRAIVLE